MSVELTAVCVIGKDGKLGCKALKFFQKWNNKRHIDVRLSGQTSVPRHHIFIGAVERDLHRTRNGWSGQARFAQRRLEVLVNLPILD